jgi:hypothetical protein
LPPAVARRDGDLTAKDLPLFTRDDLADELDELTNDWMGADTYDVAPPNDPNDEEDPEWVSMTKAQIKKAATENLDWACDNIRTLSLHSSIQTEQALGLAERYSQIRTAYLDMAQEKEALAGEAERLTTQLEDADKSRDEAECELAAASERIAYFQGIENQLTVARTTVDARDREVDALRQELRDSETRIRNLRAATADTAVTSSTNFGAPSGTKPPEKLNDGTSPRFTTWKIEILRFTRRFLSHVPDQQVIEFVSSRCTGKAKEYLEPRELEGGDGFTDLNDILDYLGQFFINRNERAELRERWANLKHKEGANGQEFLKEFLLLTVSLKTPREDFKDELWRRIPTRLRALMARDHNDDTCDWTLYQKIFLQQSEIFNAVLAEERSRQPRTPAKDRPSSNTARPKPSSTTPSRRTSTDPRFELETNADGKRWFKDPKIRELAREGKCFECHETGHSLRECPKTKSPTKAKVAVMTSKALPSPSTRMPQTPKRVGFVTPDDSDSDCEDCVSEKEDA